jgi:hypothetical protein
MAHYGPETLTILRKVLDDAWATLPDGSKSETLKSEMAQHILKLAADGVRDPVRLQASALSAVGKPSASEAKPRAKRRSRIMQTATFDERLASEAQRLKEQAKTMPPGVERDALIRRARQAETASHMNEWLTSPGLASPG